MSAVKAVSYLLQNNANLIAQVPAAKIFSGTIPLNTALPAIVVKEISAVEYHLLKTGASTFMTNRVQVAVQASTYATKKSILELIRKALVTTRGTVNSVVVDSITSDGAGPDLDDTEHSIYEQSRDFLVRWLAS